MPAHKPALAVAVPRPLSGGRIYDTNRLAERLTPEGGKPFSPRTLEYWRTRGKGPAFIKLGQRVVYIESAVERWLEEQTRTHTNEESRERR